MSNTRKRIIGVLVAALMLIVCPIAVFAAEGGQASDVVVNSATEKTYDNVSDALNEAKTGETIVLQDDAEATIVSVTEDVTLDLNGHVLAASYVTCFGNIVDNSEDNEGVLKVDAERILIQEKNAQLPVQSADGYKFYDVTKFNAKYQEDNARFVFQPFIEQDGHEAVKAGAQTSGVTINVKVSWMQDDGMRSQKFVYNDSMVSQFLDSYSEDGKYGKMFTLTLKGTEGIEELTFEAVVVSDTGVEFVSEPIVVENKIEDDNTGSGDGTEGEGPLDPGTPDDPNEPGDDDIDNKPENPGDNTGGEGNEGGDTDDPTVEFPEDEDGKISGDVSVDDNNLVEEDVELSKLGQSISATVPAGVKLEEGTTKLTLTVKAKNDSDSNVETEEDEVLKPFDVHIEGVAADNTKPIIINMGEIMPIGMNIGNYTFYHVEGDETKEMKAVASVDELNAHNQFYYDPATGNVTVCMTTFSEVAVVADTDNAWNGNFDYTWYDASKTDLTIANADQLAAFGAIVGGMDGQIQNSFSGKNVKLLSDVNIGDTISDNGKVFYPIGYYNSTESYEKKSGGSVTSNVNSFEGIFDGNGHTVSNFYQNTWEMFGDYNDGYSGTPNHYKDAMGLFGYVKGGTVKNLTVDNFSSDGEFTPTGVIAAFADGNSKFENIAITNCNPRVYNTGNGGIIGIAGDTSNADDDHIILNNITVDNSNKISALWGSWDVACGGLVGMYRGNVDGNGAATDDTISFNNCHVSAQIDVYNDVCANYQYYAYRYAGMIIGSVRHNTTNSDGKTIPNMKGISASDCTVNYGTWNDYYYCEFEENTMASYSEDYQFSRVPNSEIDTTNGKENATCIGHNHTEAEDKRAVYLPFHQLFTGYSWGVSSIGLEQYSGIVTDLGITEGDKEESVEKFEKKFTNDKFTYRVGNANTVSLGSLFAAKGDSTINSSGVVVSIDKVNEASTVSGTYTANTTDWDKGTIKFSGTGLVEITIQDYNFCTPTVLTLEVVDAVNTTSATNATKNNVVLLNDCGFSSLEVSGGYALYGNGFTMTCGSDSVAADLGYSFVTLNNGTLDNVQIVCPNFDYAALYKSNLISSDNRSETDANGKTRYYNAKSGVKASGNSQILNSRISGARAAVNVSGGNVVIDNSRIELGAVASVLVGSANSLKLKDVTLIQKPTASTYNSNTSLMGFSVLYLCDSDGEAAPTILEGSFVQNAWADESDKQYVPSNGQTIVTNALNKTDYIHDIDEDGKPESLNLGFAYMPEDPLKSINEPTNITDNRTDRDNIPYESTSVETGGASVYVFSYKNTNGTNSSFKTESEYVPNKYSDIITVTYSDTTDGLTTGKAYGTDGWVYELNVDLDKLSGYALDFSKLSMSVNGVSVTDFKVDGSDKPTSPVTVTAGGTTYTLTATIEDKEYIATYKVTGTETSKESPSLVESNYEAGLCVASSYGGTWHGAAPALERIQIKYWSVAEKQYKTINLSDYTPTTKGQLNGANTTWTYSPANGDFTLTLTGGQVHSGNSVYAMPVSVDTDNDGTADKLYFVAASSKGLVNTGNSARTIPVSYSFKDNNNGDELTFSHTWSVEENTAAQYKYSDFCEGTLTKLESGCVTPETLITLADGSQVKVEDLTGKEELLVWNLETGKYDTAPIIFVDVYDETEYEVVHLLFDDGTSVDVIYEHGFLDAETGEYIYIDADNAEKYIGCNFIKQADINKNAWDTVKLVDVELETKTTTPYSPVTFSHLCYYVDGMLSMPGGIEGLFNIFDVDTEIMAYDKAKMEADIEKYGLYAYEDFEGIIPEYAYEAFNGKYLKVAIGKGMLDWETIEQLAERYVPLM